MKNYKLLYSTGMFLACFLSHFVYGQKYKGQSQITANIGYNTENKLYLDMKYAINIDHLQANFKIDPVFAGTYDFGISDRFSLGLAYTYQHFIIDYDTYHGNDVDGNGIMYYGNFSDQFTRQSIGLRPCFHFVDNDDLDISFGARFSYVFWKYTTIRTDLNNNEVFESLKSPFKIQAVLRTTYFFTDYFGANLEFAIGPTYFVLGGLAFRFGRK